jgi:hypothetical protein
MAIVSFIEHRKPGPSPRSGIFEGPGQSSMDLPVKIVSSRGVLEEEKFQITKTEVSGFSVQVSVFLFFFPDT